MEFEKSRIERLKRALYSRNENVVPKEKRTPVSEIGFDTPKNWGERPSFEFSPNNMAGKKNSFFNKFLILSIIFFLFALGVAVFIFFGGMNMISSSNVDIKIVAPSSISSGEQLDLSVSIVNQNRTDLEEAVLFVTYPEGAKNADKSNQTLTREKVEIGTISKGKSKDFSFRTIIFGEKDAVKTFTFKLEYRVKGSNAVFSKEKTYDAVLGSSPIILNIDYPREINSGQQVSLDIELTSNSAVPVQKVLVKVEYPYGFTYKDSSMKPISNISDKSAGVWNLGDLKDGNKRSLKVVGMIVGQNMEDRTFRIFAGTQSQDSPTELDTNLAVSEATVGIRKSFYDLSVKSDSGEALNVGEKTFVTISWQNTSPDKLLNNNIEAVISGNAFDKTSVVANDGGFYRSSDNTIVWDKNSAGVLREIVPGGSGQVTFSVSSFSNPLQARQIKNPYITVDVKMFGDRSGSLISEVSSSADLTVKIQSNISLSAKSFVYSGPFSNTGPIPPRADRESTYTITWTITNTTNDLKNTSVSATLPTGIVWKGETSPLSERISYDPDNRQVVWNVGNVSSGSGYAYSPKEVSFKVGLTPSITNIGQSMILLNPSSIQATDSHTNTLIKLDTDMVTTKFSDGSFKYGQEVVGK